MTNYTSGYLNSTSGSNGNKTADAKNSSKDNSFEMFKWNNASYKQYYSSQSDARNKPSDQSKKIGPMEQPTHLKSYQPANLAESSIELSPEKGIEIKKNNVISEIRTTDHRITFQKKVSKLLSAILS